MSFKHKTFLVIIAIFLASCSIQLQSEGTATPTPYIITATLLPSLTPNPTETPLPPPPTPTIAPVQGATATQLNVRSEPSTASEVLGIITANSTVQIVGKDPGGNWWQILYEAGAEGKGWVTAQYVTTESEPNVPVVGGNETSQASGNIAVVIQQINIRSGPDTSFDSLGILNANDVVSLRGRNSDGSWLQIEFANGPDGRGWVNSGFVKADNADTLPIVADSGEVVGTITPADAPPLSTPTVVPAPMDLDSADAPLRSVTFERTGVNTLIFSGDVSAPNGDTDDWVAFTTYDDVVFANVQCEGSDSIRVEFAGTDSVLTCNQPMVAVKITKDMRVLVHVSAIASEGQLQYTQYTLVIRAMR